MSAAPKRSHEESGPSSSKYPHEDSGPYPKFSSSVSTEHRPPYEIGQENRIVKFSRIESHDMDRRSPLHTMYRMNSSSNDLHIDHPVVSENRLESKDSKDSRDYRFNNRDSKTETREVQGETRRDSQHVKSNKHVRYEGRGDDTKEIKHDQGSYNDMKSKVNMDEDVYGSSSHFNWKESKEYHRGKRYSDIPPGNAEPWISRSNSQVHPETIKEVATTEEKDQSKGHEAVGKNKFDSKGEDKLKDKDIKRKDVKHPDWGERDKGRSDHQSSMHVANISSGHKELGKDETDVERWERKDPAKDKGRLKERENDHTKRDTWNGVDKESSHNEKDLGDGSHIMLEQENIESVKQQKEADSWKCADKEFRDRRKERDIDVDGDRLEKRNRAYDKASDDGCADEGGTEREYEDYNSGVQQHKRMQRSKGSPQVAYCEPCFRTRPQEIEGSQGKAELSSVVYKVGECMQELIKLWKEYEVSQAEKNGDVSHNSPTLEIRIPAEYVTATNRQVKSGLLWGTDIYTDDSDIVAVLMHTGYCRPKTSPPPAIQELCATIRVLPPQDCYISTLRNNVRSRAWGAAIGCSYLVEQCCIIKKGGGTIDLEPCLTHTSTVEPTLAPVAVERTMTTRSAASNALRQQRFVREVTIQYNLCSEPWIKYSISIVADKDLKKPLYTSARLKKGEVLYLETHTRRYELCFTGERVIKNSQASHVHEGEPGKSQNHHTHSSNGERNDSDNTIVIDVFRWSRCRKPFPQKVMHSIGIPLPLEYVEVLEDDLDWEDIRWSQTGVWIARKEYTLARVHFLSMK